MAGADIDLGWTFECARPAVETLLSKSVTQCLAQHDQLDTLTQLSSAQVFAPSL